MTAVLHYDLVFVQLDDFEVLVSSLFLPHLKSLVPGSRVHVVDWDELAVAILGKLRLEPF